MHLPEIDTILRWFKNDGKHITQIPLARVSRSRFKGPRSVKRMAKQTSDFHWTVFGLQGFH